MNKVFALATIATLATVNASASVFSFEFPGATGGSYGINHAAGTIKSMKASYNSVTQNLSYDLRTSKTASGNKTNGFWLVLSPGANPKGHAGELAIFYFDASQSNAKISAYSYNGQNGFTSFQNQDKIWSSKNDASDILRITNRTEGNDKILGFSINASKINAHRPSRPGPGGVDEWTGAEFGNKIGIWMHPVSGLSTGYDNKGFLTKFNFCEAGWFDAENLNAVPEPASFAALGLGLLAIARKSKKK